MQAARFSVLGMLVAPVAMCALEVLMFRSNFQTSSENLKAKMTAPVSEAA
jgi:hypothetical protein